MSESFEMERGPGGWRRKEPKRTPEPVTITMWCAPSATGLIRVSICPSCKALVLHVDYPAHKRWHRDA